MAESDVLNSQMTIFQSTLDKKDAGSHRDSIEPSGRLVVQLKVPIGLYSRGPLNCLSRTRRAKKWFGASRAFNYVVDRS